MDVPPLVTERLDGESVQTRVALGGDDAVFTTPSRTLVYRAEGLLSDESVSAYPHDAERVAVSAGRRKTTIELTYVDTAGKFTVPGDRADAVLKPLLGGVLRATGAIDADEAVQELYRFSELTLVVTGRRLLKHVGGSLWDDDHESFAFADVTDLDTEEGSVATGLVLTVDGRPQRVKIPSDESRAVARAVERAVLAYHGVESVADLRPDEETTEAEDAEEFEESDIDPLVDDRADGDDGGARTAEGTSARTLDRVDSGADGGLDERIAALERAVERQNELLEEQQATIETLVDELRRGR
jgi:hypothetical protein